MKRLISCLILFSFSSLIFAASEDPLVKARNDDLSTDEMVIPGTRQKMEDINTAPAPLPNKDEVKDFYGTLESKPGSEPAMNRKSAPRASRRK